MNDFGKLKAAVTGLLGTDLPTQEGIRECIGLLRRSFPSVTDKEANELTFWFEEVHGVTMRDGAALQDSGFEPWLEDARAGLDPYYWDRYHKLLVSKDFSGHVLATLDDVTDRILGFLQNPARPGEWDRRGMVVGHVQSGKTANYTGLVCKAADAGYKVIVIIAGIHNNLRNRTQRRSTRDSSGSTVPAVFCTDRFRTRPSWASGASISGGGPLRSQPPSGISTRRSPTVSVCPSKTSSSRRCS